MGIILLPFYLVGIVFYVMFYKALRVKGFGGISAAVIVLIATLPFTYDIVITNLLSLYYCKIAPPNPKTKIEKRVEYPISIYWEDNVYPGFNKEDRELMIINYLDGEHLKMIALNGPEGKIYVYRAKEGEYERIKKEYNISEWYKRGIKEYAKAIMKRVKIYTKQTMPKTNYTVTFNEVKLPKFVRHFLYSDETKVIENNTSRVIAYNRRYMRFFYNIFPDAVGGLYYYPEPMCGYEFYRSFDEKVFPTLKYMYGGDIANHKSLNEVLYEKYIKKGEK